MIYNSHIKVYFLMIASNIITNNNMSIKNRNKFCEIFFLSYKFTVFFCEFLSIISTKNKICKKGYKLHTRKFDF